MQGRRLAQMTRTLREERGWTQAALAAKVQVTQSYIAKLETGVRTSVSLTVLQRLAKVFQVSPTVFLKK